MSKLTEILDNMLSEAQRTSNPVTCKLKNGLHISITEDINYWTLALSRDNNAPDTKEWEVILKYFPYYTGKILPVQFVDAKKRMALQAKIPKRHIAQLKF